MCLIEAIGGFSFCGADFGDCSKDPNAHIRLFGIRPVHLSHFSELMQVWIQNSEPWLFPENGIILFRDKLLCFFFILFFDFIYLLLITFA